MSRAYAEKYQGRHSPLVVKVFVFVNKKDSDLSS